MGARAPGPIHGGWSSWSPEWTGCSKNTFNTVSAISWQSALLVKEIRVNGKKHQPAASH
jgi:hypothetical protein